ncbi:DapH/DapD/GlmU-related protein [Clostridium sp. DSM 8431]|uniref:DapH/DapD/GlmU-related protein n=1 Tax=Clostridium sp. DSM 8431 TaxID=1761781 RepID=UPI0011136EF9|nr:DapH/DapD/GlmU-related protein [Clostridium sp. DSM 8431]
MNIVEKWIEKGIKFVNPANVEIDDSVILEHGVTIGSFVVLRGDTHIGKNTYIGEFSALTNAKIGENVEIDKSTIMNSRIEDNVTVGPYAFIRGNAVIKNSASIGAYSEINDTQFGEKSKCKHFSYIGHTTLGTNVNIGAGTITCTYDGKRKYKSTIGDGAFVGSGSLMVAPSTIGKNSRTGAGSVITREVKENSLVYGVPAKEK